MYKTIISCVATVTVLGMLIPSSNSLADEGEKKYLSFLCDNCHGKDGKSPKSDIIPVIGGKGYDFIRKEAADILSGERKGRAVVMHAKYYSTQATSESCDIGPSATELDSIAKWLSTR
ncbi:MAG: hypothetical protein HW380_1998 [Magnetococcales bacterium]|nr:hypothetical protein [Magnetococcales bacterium]